MGIPLVGGDLVLKSRLDDGSNEIRWPQSSARSCGVARLLLVFVDSGLDAVEQKHEDHRGAENRDGWHPAQLPFAIADRVIERLLVDADQLSLALSGLKSVSHAGFGEQVLGAGGVVFEFAAQLGHVLA